MRARFSIFFISILSFSIYGQGSSKTIKFKNPPGTTKLNDSVYIDVSPIENVMYKEFIYNLDSFWNENIHQYIKTINSFGLSWEILESDTGFKKANYDKKTRTTEAYNILTIDSTNQYVKSPEYNNFPVLNITKEEAELYCKWRTDMVKLIWAINSKNEKKRAKYPKDILYRLPTIKEFNEALDTFGFTKKKKDAYNKLAISPYWSSNVRTYRKALFFKHNISEYTLNSIPFGTNWKNKKTFTSLNDYTGFRCICEIKN